MTAPVTAETADAELQAELQQLRARVLELEAEVFMLRGTMAKPETDEPTTYAHDVLPNAPR